MTHSFYRSYGFLAAMLACIVLGCAVGAAWPGAVCLEPLGTVFINMMFCLVVPLVFCSLAGSIANTRSRRRAGRILGATLGVFVVTGLLAAFIMLVIVRVFPPVLTPWTDAAAGTVDDPAPLATLLVNFFTVNDFSALLSRRAMLPLILFTIFFGFCLQSLGERGRAIGRGISVVADAMLQMVKYLMYYAPIGLGAYFATLVGDYGPQLLGAYFRAMVVYHVATFGYFFIAFTIYAWWATEGRGVKVFWSKIIAPALMALGSGSSTATLPVNLEAASDMGIPRDISEIVLPIGATAHMEGSCLSGILKIAFLFGIFGLPFTSLGTMATAVAVAVLSGVVLSGIPGGGLVGEMLIVSLYGFPPEAFPIIATIGFLVDPAATMVNATGDTCSALMISRLVEGKNWFAKANVTNL